jgi:hypothetical protein
MRHLLIALVSFAVAHAAVTKTPTDCATRPCLYEITCDAASCTAGELAEVQAALSNAYRGDTISLEAGRIWEGTLWVTARPGSSGYLTIQSSAVASLPDGVRVTPGHAPLMPRIQLPPSAAGGAWEGIVIDSSTPPVEYVRFIGLEIAGNPAVTGAQRASLDLVRLDQNTATSIDQLPNHIEFLRCYLHGAIAGEVRNAFLANARDFVLRDSYLSEIKMVGIETHGVSSYNSPGPFTVENNYIEAAGIGMLWGGGSGGGSITTEMNPSNGVIRYNYVTRPLKWFSASADFTGAEPIHKNLLEWKQGSNWLVEYNLLTNSYKGAQNNQSGAAVAVNMRLPFPDATWAVTEDIIFRRNMVRGAAGTWSSLGKDDLYGYTGTVRRIAITDNLFTDIGKQWFSSNSAAGLYFGRVIYGQEDFAVERNTTYYLHQNDDDQGVGISYEGSYPIVNFTFRDNLTPRGQYGFKMSGYGSDGASLTAGTTGTLVVTNNTFPGASTFLCTTCSDNMYPARASWDANIAGWVSPSTGDYSLGAESPYLTAGSTGGPLGADMDALAQIRTLTVTPAPTSAALTWTLTDPISTLPCTLEVSSDRNLLSKLGAWTLVSDTDPSVGGPSGTISGGASRSVAVNGLTPATTYYYRLMCPGDAAEGSVMTSGQMISQPTRVFGVRISGGRIR